MSPGSCDGRSRRWREFGPNRDVNCVKPGKDDLPRLHTFSLLPHQLFHQFLGVVQLAERFQHAVAVDGDVAGLHFGVDEVADEAVAVAVEVEADEFAVAIDMLIFDTIGS